MPWLLTETVADEALEYYLKLLEAHKAELKEDLGLDYFGTLEERYEKMEKDEEHNKKMQAGNNLVVI